MNQGLVSQPLYISQRNAKADDCEKPDRSSIELFHNDFKSWDSIKKLTQKSMVPIIEIMQKIKIQDLNAHILTVYIF